MEKQEEADLEREWPGACEGSLLKRQVECHGGCEAGLGFE